MKLSKRVCQVCYKGKGKNWQEEAEEHWEKGFIKCPFPMGIWAVHHVDLEKLPKCCEFLTEHVVSQGENND